MLQILENIKENKLNKLRIETKYYYQNSNNEICLDQDFFNDVCSDCEYTEGGWVNDSFDHEFGTEHIPPYYECEGCNHSSANCSSGSDNCPIIDAELIEYLEEWNNDYKDG